MGYNIEEMKITARLDNHLDERTLADREAWRLFRETVQALIESSPDYNRIIVGVMV